MDGPQKFKTTSSGDKYNKEQVHMFFLLSRKSKMFVFTVMHFDAQIQENLGNENSDVGHTKWAMFPTPRV